MGELNPALFAFAVSALPGRNGEVGDDGVVGRKDGKGDVDVGPWLGPAWFEGSFGCASDIPDAVGRCAGSDIVT